MSENTFVIDGYKNGDPFLSGDQVQFRIRRGELEDPNVLESSAIVFQVPNWPDLVTSMNATYNITESSENVFGANREFRITRYQVYNIDGQHSRLSLVLQTEPSTINVRDRVLITASVGNALRPINGNIYARIQPLTTGRTRTTGPRNIDLRIPRHLIPDAAQNLQATSSIREVQNTIKYFNYSFRIGPTFYRNFINKDNVKDVLIFAYTRVNDVENVTEQKYLFKNNTDIQISESTPPAYSDVSYMVGKSGSDARFEPSKIPVVNVYVAIARYKKINGIWSGEWLQKNEFGTAIWKTVQKAVGS